MSRPTRLRRLPVKYQINENSPEEEKITSGRAEAQKGNNIKKVLVVIKSPVLRDRTNFTVESAKVNVLKKGFEEREVGAEDNATAMKRNTRGSRNKETAAENEKRSTRNSEKVEKNSTDEKEHKLQSETVKVPIRTRSIRNPSAQVTEVEPKVTPALQKPTRISPATRITRKNSKADDLIPNNAETAVKKQPKHSKGGRNSPGELQNAQSKKTSVSSKNSPKRVDLPAKRSSTRLKTKSPKKFFKNKRNVTLTHSKVSPMKRALKNARRPLTHKKNTPASLSPYQPTLRESFLKAKKSLRPRRAAKNYNESTITDDKTSSGDKTKTKAPIYKTLKEDEDPKDNDKVYEFKFDINDSNERLPKKRKKRVVRKVPVKRVKTAAPATELKEFHKNDDNVARPATTPLASESEKIAEQKAPTTVVLNPKRKVAAKKPLKIKQSTINLEKIVKDIAANPEEWQDVEKNPGVKLNPVVSDKMKAPIVVASADRDSPGEDNPHSIEVIVDIHEAPEDPPSSPLGPPELPEDTLQVPEPQKPAKNKPKVISDERLSGERRISLSSTPLQGKSNSEEFRPYRPTNPFNHKPSIQYKTMMNHSLIRRSFSPIVKENSSEFDVNSPWRPVVVDTFSRVKNVFQSTPHGKKFMTPRSINSVATENKGLASKIGKIMEHNDENDNLSVIGSNSPSKSPRKFGTILSNVGSNPSSPSKSPTNKENSTISGDKENKSPRKSPQKKIRTSMKSPPHRIAEKNNAQTVEPQPGPSGLQQTTNAKILKQSNLNNFLNIPDMPAGTTITTAHGIFDDAHSTPVPGKAPKKVVKDFDVENAFGFDDETCPFDVSPISENAIKYEVKKPAEQIKPVVTVVVKEPIRLPIRETKKSEAERNFDKIEKIQTNNEEAKIKDKKPAEATKRDVVEAVHFLDTFDEKDGEESPVEVPLFVDPEPVHFKQPPRHSYSKRKRAIRFNTSDEAEHQDSDSDEDDHPRHKRKKLKMSKAEKEQQKQLDEWAKSINKTFEEIEHFDLAVE